MLKFWTIVIPIIFCLIVIVGTFPTFSYRFKQKGLKIGLRCVALSVISGLLAGNIVVLIEALIFETYSHDGLYFYEDLSGGKILLGVLTFLLTLISVLLFAGRKDDEILKIFWFLLILTLLLYLLLIGFVESSFIQKSLKNVDYSISNVETIYLEPLNGNMGLGDGPYISINTNQREINYVIKVENGSLSFEKMDYDKNFCDIFEDDLEIPRIEISTYSRELFDVDGDVIAHDSYEKYEIFIPTGGYIETNSYNASKIDNSDVIIWWN